MYNKRVGLRDCCANIANPEVLGRLYSLVSSGGKLRLHPAQRPRQKASIHCSETP